MKCPISGSCEFSLFCDRPDLSELVLDRFLADSPEVYYLRDDLTPEQLDLLAAPVVEAWNTDDCVKEKIRALKGLQFADDISHVSSTLGLGIAVELEKVHH